MSIDSLRLSNVKLIIIAFGLLLAGLLIFNQPVSALSREAFLACQGSGGTPVDANGTEITDVTSAGSATECQSSGLCLFGGGCLFERVANGLIFVVAAVSVIFIIIGGAKYVLSSGDANQVTAAKNTILYALIGLAVAFAAFGIVNFVVNQL